MRASIPESEPIVTPVFRGGLGNNLFQIAAAEYLALRSGGRTRYYRQSADAPREYRPFGGHPLIGARDLPGSLDELFPALDFSAGTSTRKAIRAAVDRVVEEADDYRFRRSPMPQARGQVVIEGYFFDTPVRGRLRQRLKACLTPDDRVSRYISSRYGHLFDRPTVSLHFRAGNPHDDYAVPQNSYQWYKRVLARCPANARVIVCSDDPPAAREFLQSLHGMRNVVYVAGEPMYVDLFLMARCTHHIGHNSTLSAWAAFLSEGRGRVYAHLDHYTQVHGLRAWSIAWRDSQWPRHLLRALRREWVRWRERRALDRAVRGLPPFRVRLRRRLKRLLGRR